MLHEKQTVYIVANDHDQAKLFMENNKLNPSNCAVLVTRDDGDRFRFDSVEAYDEIVVVGMMTPDVKYLYGLAILSAERKYSYVERQERWRADEHRAAGSAEDG